MPCRVCHYYENCCDRSQKRTVHHFVEEGTSRKTIYSILARYRETGESKYKSIPGRPAVKMSSKEVKKVEKAFTDDPTLSVRVAARKLNMPPSTVSQIKVHKLGITARTRIQAPKYISDQESRPKTGCRKVYEKTRKKLLTIDAEDQLTGKLSNTHKMNSRSKSADNHLLEVCIDNLSSGIEAEAGGAGRIELCSSLAEGGLTPSVGFLKVIKSLIKIPVFVMIRPRGGDFLYSKGEIKIMQVRI